MTIISGRFHRHRFEYNEDENGASALQATVQGEVYGTRSQCGRKKSRVPMIRRPNGVTFTFAAVTASRDEKDSRNQISNPIVKRPRSFPAVSPT